MNGKVKKEIKLVSLVKLTFSPKEKPVDFKWSREGEEFTYRNEMYDIVKTKFSEGKVIYYCLRDNAEKKLNDVFDLLIKKENQKDKEGNLNFAKELSKYNLSFNSFLNFSYNSLIHDDFKRVFYKNTEAEVNLPPPKYTLLD